MVEAVQITVREKPGTINLNRVALFCYGDKV